jgi:hypothetical protein
MANGWVARHGDRWRARYGHPELGTEHQATFDRKVDAQRWLRLELAKVDSGTWVDSSAGTVTLEVFFESCGASGVDGEPQVAMSLAVRQTPFRSMELGEIRTTHVETWIKSMTVPNESGRRWRRGRSRRDS